MPTTFTQWLRIITAVSGLYLLSLVTPIYLPIILSAILAFILNPLVNFLGNCRLWPGQKKSLPRGFAVVLSFITAAVIIFILGTIIFSPFIREFNNFVINLPSLIAKIQNITAIIEKRANTVVLPENVRVLIDQAFSSAAVFSIGVARRIINAVFGFASQIVELVVVPVLTFYFLKDWQSLKKAVLLPFSLKYRNKAQTIIEEISVVISGYIRGQVLVSMIMGVFVAGGMYWLDVEYPLVLGLIAMLTETIPIIGPIIGAVPAIVLAYLAVPDLTFKVILFYLAIHQLENHIIVPNIMKRTIDLHPVVVIISLLIGGHLLGVAGMMLAVPVVAILLVCYKHLWYYEEG